MKVPFLELGRSVDAMRAELDAILAGVLDESWFVQGPAVERFEQAFAQYCGVGHAVGVASGTDAIEVGLRALGIGPGDEVVTAANTCVPTIAGIEGAGATPVLADVDPETMTLDTTSVEEAVTERTRAIVPVHLYGRCADMDALLELAAEHGLKVFEDAAQAHGASWKGRRAGSIGNAGAFSFYPTKNLGAIGDAGAVVTDDPEIAERVRRLRSYGERTRYDSVESGRNSRLDTLQAAVLLAKLERLDTWTARRRELAALYDEALAAAGLGHQAADSGHVYHLYVVRAPNRHEFRERLAADGVETLVHYPRAVHQHDAYGHLASPRLAVSEQLAASVLSLPLYPELTDTEAAHVVSAVSAAAPAFRSTV